MKTQLLLFVTVGLTAAPVLTFAADEAKNPFDDRLANLPTAEQMMNLSPADRVAYQKGLQQILGSIAAESDALGLQMGLVADVPPEETPFTAQYVNVINLIGGLFVDQADAASGGSFFPDANCEIPWISDGSWTGQAYENCPDNKHRKAKFYPDQTALGGNNFEPAKQAKKFNCDKINRADAQKKFIAASQRDAKNFKDDSGVRCIYAGNISGYGGDIHTGKCKPPQNHFCVDSPEPTALDPAPPCKYDLTCENTSQIVCNPLAFGVEKIDRGGANGARKITPFCVDKGAPDATAQCGTKAHKVDNRFDILGQLRGPWFDRWNEFAKKFNGVCAKPVSRDAMCTECETLYAGLEALNKKFENKLFLDGRHDMIVPLLDRNKGVQGETGGATY